MVRRIVWIGVLGVFLAALTLGILVFGSFKDDEKIDPTRAGVELENRTPDEVEASRTEVEARQEKADPESPREGTTPAGGTPDATTPPGSGEEAPPGSGEEAPPDPASIPNADSPALPDEMFDAVVLIGADASGYLADSIILALFPQGGSAPALVSIPRDLYLYNFCSEDYRRVNANLGGCPGYASGSELLALTIEDFTGVEVDHYVRVDFDGFVELVDGLGGIEICFEYPTYDEKAALDVAEPGCLLADGALALAYSRSRNASQLVDGEWRRAWSSDFSRQAHQRELLVKLAGEMQRSSLGDLLSVVQNLSHTVRLDRGWSIAEAVEWAWRYRDLDLSQVAQLSIPVEDYRTSNGASVLLPVQPFNEVLSRWWGPAER